ncbi:unnamed protein product [Larinioides sclopetarius]|uniref:Uncharacterized protein n=1 Tax=Larinioides sclopetarius TaxID=280406 RepID=A0AAV1ZLY4_9ARAC
MKIGIATGSKSLGKNFQAGYFHVLMRNLNDTPVMSSVKLVSFPDGWLNSFQPGPTSFGFHGILKWAICWTLYSRNDIPWSCLLE